MADQNFHEIQLSGKQLIFLFMCAVVLTVVVFLFGVSVGRQVPATAAQEAETVSVPPPSAAAEPAGQPAGETPAAANEASYMDALQGSTEDPTKAAPPAPVSDEPTTVVQVAEAAPPPVPAKKAAPPPPAGAKAAPKATPAPAGANAWFVQVGAYAGNDVANREVTKLKGRGYPATVFTEPPTVPGPRYKVRVGPYERAEADSVRAQLSKEGYPSFLRR